MRDGDLGEQAGLGHHLDGLVGVVTLGGLTRQHDTVGTVKDGVGNIGHLGTSGTRVVCHGLEHLSGTDDGLTLDVTLGDHHLLGDEDLGGWDLDTKVTTGNHDTVSLLEDLVEVVDTLLVLNLGNDLDLLALLTQNLTDVADVATAADERSEDHVDLVLNTELEIGNILLGKGGEVNVSAGQVNTLAGGDVAVVQAADADGLVVYDFEDLEGKDTVINIDELARRDHLGDVLVVEVPTRRLVSGVRAQTSLGWSPNPLAVVGRTRGGGLHVLVVGGGGILIIGGDVELVALLDRDILIVGGVSGTDLGTFLRRSQFGDRDRPRDRRTYGIESNGERTSDLGLGGLTGVVDNRLVVLGRVSILSCANARMGTASYLIGTVGEVHANNVKTGCKLVS